MSVLARTVGKKNCCHSAMTAWSTFVPRLCSNAFCFILYATLYIPCSWPADAIDNPGGVPLLPVTKHKHMWHRKGIVTTSRSCYVARSWKFAACIDCTFVYMWRQHDNGRDLVLPNHKQAHVHTATYWETLALFLEDPFWGYQTRWQPKVFLAPYLECWRP